MPIVAKQSTVKLAHATFEMPAASDLAAEGAAVRLPRLDQLPLGELRLLSLHSHESIEVQPFGVQGKVHAEGLKQVQRLMRCRVTGHEVAIDRQLVRILTMVSMIYGKTLHLVSGHRFPNTIGTSETSQHALGKAADIRVPGVSVDELATLVSALGARGIGLYRHKNFLHVDVRDKAKYVWEYDSADPEKEEVGDESSEHEGDEYDLEIATAEVLPVGT